MRKKFKKRIIVIPLLCIGIVGGTAAYGINQYRNSSMAKVVPVSEIVNDWVADNTNYETSAQLKKGSTQNVMIDSDLKVSEVLVKKGDVVNKGDALINYDTASLEMNVEEIENNIKAIENNEKIQNNELDILRRLQPSENAPQEPDYEPPEEPDYDTDSTTDTDTFKYEKTITTETKPISGDGTAENPFVFTAGTDTIVARNYIEYLAGTFPQYDSPADVPDDGSEPIDTDNGGDMVDTDNTEQVRTDCKYALINVYSNDGIPLFSRQIDGDKIKQEEIADWSCADGVSVKEDGSVVFGVPSVGFASFLMGGSALPSDGFPTDTDFMDGMGNFDFPDDLDYPDSYSEPESNNVTSTSGELSLNDNYVYSQEELKNMITEHENKIQSLGLEKKQANIDLTKAKKRLENGSENASISGTVTFVAESEKSLAKNGAYVIITSDNGVSVMSEISEFDLDKIDLDMQVNLINYADYSQYTGVITEIGDTPNENTNTTTSFYNFTVAVEGDLDITEDDYINVSIPDKVVSDENSENDSGTIIIEVPFIREENGKYFVMVADENDTIVKRYITLGKWYYGHYVEIKSGLYYEEEIALPYGNVKEGMPVNHVRYQDLYGMFF
ncbi:MAG: HlyD family secretion protein [Lachnospiraceae bacterium]|nr:HlyD family secretion protein [Lachnospiraceae bacterium]